MNRLILISPDQGSGFKPILSGKGCNFGSEKSTKYKRMDVEGIGD